MKYAKIILAIALLLCIAPMPYGYYNLVRFASMIVFGILAYLAQKDEKTHYLIIYAALAILFQPFFKIALGRDLWHIIDISSAILLIVQIIKQKLKK